MTRSKPLRGSPRRLIAPAVLALVLVAGGANARSPSRATPGADWQFRIAPYLWAAGLEGDVATLPNLPAVAVDESFGDILENTDFAFALLGEARRGNWAISLDTIYQSLSSGASTPGPLFSDVDLDSTIFVGTPALTYRTFASRQATFKIGAGARFWYLDNELGFGAGLLPAVSSSESEWWADPIALLRGRLDLGSNFFLSAYGDVGGFGVGSDLTWQVMGLLGYRFSDLIEGSAGYRYLSVDYENDGFVWDVEMSGPILGVTVRF